MNVCYKLGVRRNSEILAVVLVEGLKRERERWPQTGIEAGAEKSWLAS